MVYLFLFLSIHLIVMALFSFYIILHLLSKGGNGILNKHFCLNPEAEWCFQFK